MLAHRPGVPVGTAGLHALHRWMTAWLSVVDTGGGPPGAASSSPPPSPGEADDAAELERVHALVTLAQAGDGEAFAVLYERSVDTVHRYLYYRLGSRQLAEDLTQETFLRALRRLDSFHWTGKDIAAWFVTIARNLVMDHVKSSRYKLEVTTGEMLDGDQRAPAPDEEVLERLRDQRLLAAMRQLRPEQQECLSLRFLQGLSLAETAEVLGRSAGAVKQLQLRAVRALHKELGGSPE